MDKKKNKNIYGVIGIFFISLFLIFPFFATIKAEAYFEYRNLDDSRTNICGHETKESCISALKVACGEDTLGDCVESSEGNCVDGPVICPEGDTPVEKSIYKLLAPIGGFETAPEDIGEYFNKIFTIAIGLCAALAVIMIVIGGIQYMGDESVFGKTEGKKQITMAILGLIIALGAYALLRTINPDLLGGDGVSIKQVSIKIEPLYDRGINDQKNANGESVRCTPVLSGPCSVENLTKVFGAENAVAMSKICLISRSGFVV